MKTYLVIYKRRGAEATSSRCSSCMVKARSAQDAREEAYLLIGDECKIVKVVDEDSVR